MHQFPIGVLLTSFHEEEKAAVRNAKTCGAAGMQVPVVRGELAGDALVGEAVYDEALSAFKLEIGSNGMPLGDYCTYSAVVEKVEVYAGEKLVLVRNY